MRSFLSKFCGMFLAGALFAVAGCTDYDEDIREINDKLDNEIAVSISSLDDAIKSLEAKVQSDYALKSEVSALKSSLESKINDEVAKLNASVESLQKSLNDLASKAATKDELNSAKAELKSQIDKAVADANAAIAAINSEIAKLNANKADKTYVDELVAGLDKKISNLNEALNELANTVQSNTSDINDLKLAVSDLKEADIVLNAAIAAVAERCDAIEARISADEEKIASLTEELAALKEAVAKNEADIAANAAAIKVLVDADLITRVGVLETSLSDHIAEYAKHIEAYNAAIKELKDKDSELAGLIKSLEGRVEELESSVEELQGELDELTETVSGIRSDLDDLAAKAATKEELAAAKKELEDKISALDSRMTAAENSLKDVIARVDALEIDVDKLLSRVQSLVYIPDYSDGKADINVLRLDNSVFVEGTSVLRYKVSPAEYAEDLAAVAADVFSYDLREVKIRTRAAALPEMTVVSAVCVDPASGEIALTVKTRNFGDAFYMDENSYSAALVLVQENEEESRNISSEFTNLVPAVRPVQFRIFDVTNEDITNRVVEPGIEISYNSTKKYPVLKGHHPVFVLDNKNMTPEEMVAAGYEVAVSVEPAFAEIMSDLSESDGCFLYEAVDSVAYPYLEVYLAKADKEKIGHTAYGQYNYVANGIEYYTGQEIVIVKEKASVTVPAEITVNWNYALDAEIDAQRINNFATALYKRTFEYAVSDLDAENVPEDIDLYELLTDADNTTCFIGGKEVVATTLPQLSVVKAEPDTIAINVNGFEWNHTYPVKFVVSTEQIEVTFELTINTVDRVRDALTIEIGETSVEYAKNMEVKAGAHPYELAPIFDSLTVKKNLGVSEIAGADYIKDIFKTHAVADVKNVVDGQNQLDTYITRLVFGDFENDDFTFSPAYTYRTFKEVHTTVPYSKTFTTWYGQVITIQHTLNFTLPGYDFEHVPVWVKKNTDGYFSRVMGKYSPDGVMSVAVDGFSVADIDLDAAFDVINVAGERLDSAALAKLGLVTEFVIESESHDGIEMKDNVLSYCGKADYVDVMGNLYIVNDNASRVQLPTNFDADHIYSTYVVRKYDPIGEFSVVANPRIDVIDSREYPVNILDYVTLKDNRDGRAAYDLIADGEWVVGNGLNGYADRLKVVDIYGLKVTYGKDDAWVPASVKKFITFDETTGILTFDASKDLTLVEPVDVKLTVSVDYTWGTKTGEITVTFFRSNGAPVE